tara:strand:+ start:3852 stop:4595 length:744 start_codon:yes stop_codon:yes gene_type:complete
VEQLAFVMLVGLGAFIQTIAGFAMGLIVMGGVALFGLVEISAAAAVVSIISLLNVSVALRRTYRYVDRTFVIPIVLGMLPLVVVGVFLLDYWSAENYELLRMVLGIVIVGAGFLLMLKPAPYQKASGPVVSWLIGSVAGLMGGLYGASGAPVAYYMYRQPLMIQAVRATLLATFALSSLFRSGFVAWHGHVTPAVLWLTIISIPMVIGSTLIGSKLLPYVPDALVRRIAFALLILLGVSLIVMGLTD